MLENGALEGRFGPIDSRPPARTSQAEFTAPNPAIIEVQVCRGRAARTGQRFVTAVKMTSLGRSAVVMSPRALRLRSGQARRRVSAGSARFSVFDPNVNRWQRCSLDRCCIPGQPPEKAWRRSGNFLTHVSEKITTSPSCSAGTPAAAPRVTTPPQTNSPDPNPAIEEGWFGGGPQHIPCEVNFLFHME